MKYPKIRLSRLRRSKGLRKLFGMPELSLSQFIYPVFVIEGKNRKEEITSMPGQERVSADQLPHLLEKMVSKGLGGVLIFGVPEKGKDPLGSLAYVENGLVPTAIQMIKKEFPDLPVFTDVCLCAYTDHGHCGILDTQHRIDYEESLKYIQKMALNHAKAGADGVAPSAMLDQQVEAIREALNAQDFQDVLIMSYSTKFASSLYTPFREAAGSAPLIGNRKAYQAPFNDLKQALRESLIDEQEGADILMVKPALFYLDIIIRLKKMTNLPLATYNVSGEYSMIYQFAHNDEKMLKSLVIESLTAQKRAGSDIIISYWPKVLSDLNSLEL